MSKFLDSFKFFYVILSSFFIYGFIVIMPIPRRNKDEFFISSVNKYIQEDTSDQAIIYQPYVFSLTQVIGNGRNIENIEEFIIHIETIFSCVYSIDPFHSDTNDLMTHFFTYMFFYDHLRTFIRSNRRNNIVSLAHDFYLDIRDNFTFTLLLGSERAQNLKDAIFRYYKELIKQKEEEEKESKPDQKKVNFNIQFKEFKVHQNYVEMKNYKEIKNINVKKYQHYLRCSIRKNRNKVFCNHFVINCFWYKTKTVIGKNFYSLMNKLN